MAGLSSRIGTVAVLLFLPHLFLPVSSRAWEKNTSDRIVKTALSDFHGEPGSFLAEKASFFRQGLGAAAGTVQQYAGFSRYDTTGYAAGKLGGQIDLLRDLFPEERSDYMAFRLGILTRLVMELSSPFAASSAREADRLRAMFTSDAESHLAELKYTPRQPRLIRSPVSFVGTRIERSAGWAGPVRSQYLSGKGYNFIVQQAASKFYGEAINSVADVLYTVGAAARGKVAAPVRYEFYRDECAFYLGRGMGREALGSYGKMGRIAVSEMAAPLDSLEAAVDRYSLILQVESLEEGIAASGVAVDDTLGKKLMEPFLSAVSRLAKGYIAGGNEDKARIALDLCLRERYLPEWSLASLRKLYGLDKLENLDVAENAWKVYLEANGFESMAGKALSEGRLWAANAAYMRAAALYSAIPESVRDLRRTSLARIDQILSGIQSIPPEALLSEEFFQAAVDSIAEGDVDSAVRDFQVSRRWGPGGKAIDSASADAESLQLFVKGRDLYQDGKYDEGAGYFRKLTTRFPAGPFSEPAKKMLELYEKKRSLESGKLVGILKGAYEASFVGDEETVFNLCDEVMASSPTGDLRDRAQLLMAVAWYQANQKGYLKIERVFKDLLKHRVLKESGGKLVLRKKLDFYFGLKDPFPEIDLEKLDASLLAKMDLTGAEPPSSGEQEVADDAIAAAGDKIETVDDLISRGEEEERDMGEARSLLDDASGRLDAARDRFDEGAYAEAKEAAEESLAKAEAAEEKAEELLDISESLKSDAQEKLDEAEAAVAEAESALAEAEDEREVDFSQIRSDIEDAASLLEDATSLFEGGDYEAAIEKASEAIDDAEKAKEKAENLKEGGEE